MKKLPDHTTRYFASQDYRLWFHHGSKGPWKHKTVQGVELWVEYDPAGHSMHCKYEINGVATVKVHRVAKSWAY